MDADEKMACLEPNGVKAKGRLGPRGLQNNTEPRKDTDGHGRTTGPQNNTDKHGRAQKDTESHEG